MRAAIASLMSVVFQIAACTQAARSSASATLWSRANSSESLLPAIASGARAAIAAAAVLASASAA